MTPVSPAPLSPHAALAEKIIGSIVLATDLAVSPDGAWIAFVVARVDMAKNTNLSQVWLAATDGSVPPRPVTGGEHDGNPAWSPDGARLAFTSRRNATKGETTIHLLPVGTPGETLLVATMKDDIAPHLAFSPDGRWIGFVARTPHERYDAVDESWQAPRKIERFFTQVNGEGWVFDRPQHLYVVPADGTGAPRNLTPGEFEHGSFAWLPDSKGMVVHAQRHPTWDRDLATDLYLVPLQGEITAITERTGTFVEPLMSPDGTTIAFLGVDDATTYPQNMHIGLVPLTGGTHRWISRGLDRTFETTAGIRAPRWLDDTRLIASAEDRGETHLFEVAVDGSAPARLTTGAITVKAFDAAGGTVAYCAGSVDELTDVFVLTDGEPRRLTNFAASYRSAVAILPWERFAAPCSDGTGEVDAWIMRPAGFDPAKQYPVILNVHGGPHTQYGESFFDEAQMQAAAGFVVLMSNPRGGSGREEAWGQAIMGPHHPRKPGNGWGSVDVDDVLAVLDTALARYPFCDAARVGMQGGSYGGYMATMLAAKHGHRFAAVCSERAVNNMLTEEYTSDIATVFRVELGPSHIDMPEEYLRISPVQFARDIAVPFLIIHSENDLRCPISQAEELFVALRLLGKDVTFYRFPGENHELSRSGSPIHRRQRAEIVLDFFAQQLATQSAS